MNDEREAHGDERENLSDERENLTDDVEAHSFSDRPNESHSDHDTDEGADVEGHMLTETPLDT